MDFPGEKLVIKLWETLTEKGIGSLLTPWQVKREGRVRMELRRDELLMLAQVEKDVADVRAGRKQLQKDGTLMLTSGVEPGIAEGDLPLVCRFGPTLGLPDAICLAEATIALEHARKEINFAKAVLYAEEQLAGDSQQPPDRQVDEDWINTWKEYAGRVAAEDLQRLWGSVLAGEIKSPGRYSIRTMEFLKTLSKAEAEVISKLARYSINGRIARSDDAYLEANGISFGLLLQMQDLGIVSGVEAIGLNITYKTIVAGKFVNSLISNGKTLIVEHDDPEMTLTLEVYPLTEVGMQILGLGSFEPDIEYLTLVGKQIARRGFRVQLCDWRQLSETQGQYFNAVHIDA